MVTDTPNDRAVAFAPPSITDDDIDAVVAVLRSGWLTSGTQVRALERELADYLDAPDVVVVSSGTASLEIAFAFLDLPPRARVGIPTWTFAASALAPARLGAIPVLLDVDADSLNLSAPALEAALATGLDAVVAVHFGGVPVVPEIHRLCASAGVPVVEDAAHAFSASDHRGRLSGRGSVGAGFSFYATKNLTSAEGGALATHDPAVASFARTFRLHGLSASGPADNGHEAEYGYDCTMAGAKANLSDVLAALARSQLSRIHEFQARRRALVERYRDRLGPAPDVGLVPDRLAAGGSDHLLVVLVPEGTRPAVRAALAREGVQTSIHFRPLHDLRWFRDHAEIGPGGVPVADRLAARALSLPLHIGMADHDVDTVCDVLVDSLAG
jgi:dTDP-4-amino-4,6-dideoxygalactose transaminase